MTKTIASLYFEERRLTRPLYGGNFYAPAVPKGAKPFLLEVRDHRQPEKQPHIVGGHIIPRTITGEEIAADIVLHWTSGALGMKGDVRPGIWVVRDTITQVDENGVPIKDVFGAVQYRPATDEEKAAMWAEDVAENTACQARWGEFKIAVGDSYAKDENSKMRLLIDPTMKAAAKYYGRDREWLDELKDGDTKTCQFCFKAIDARVLTCPNCREVVDRKGYDAATAKPPVPPPLNPGGKQQAA